MSTLAEKIAEQIRSNAGRHLAPWSPATAEMAAEIERLAAENAGLRMALAALKDDRELAKDLQAVREACADRIDEIIDEAEPAASLKHLDQLADSMRGHA